jgi:hypothetical protein
MWEHYKKTFVRVQIVIAVVTAVALMRTHSAMVSGVLCLTMELFSVYGALWAVRVKRFAQSRDFERIFVRRA